MVVFASAMQDLYNNFVPDIARETGFEKRSRQLSGSSFVQTLVFTWISQPDATLSDFACTAATLNIQVSEQAIDQRFTPEATEMVKRTLEKALQMAIGGNAHPDNSLLNVFSEVNIIDTTIVKMPLDILDKYPEFACASSVPDAQTAAMKISAFWDLKLGQIGFSIVNGNIGDCRCPERSDGLPKHGSLNYADLAYFDLETFEKYNNQGIYWMSRHMTGTRVKTMEDGKVYEKLSSFLENQGPEVTVLDIDVKLGVKQVKARLVAMRLSPESAKNEAQKVIDNAKKKAVAVSQESLKLSKWVVFECNVPREMLGAEEILKLGRIRWQIELLFKIWKSMFKIDEWRTKNPERIMCEIYGKMIAALTAHWLVVAGTWEMLDRSVVKAVKSVRSWAERILAGLSESAELLAKVLEKLMKRMSRCRQNRRVKKPGTWQFLETEASEATAAKEPEKKTKTRPADKVYA